MVNYFPTRLATGLAFCNRKKELQRLKYNIKGNNPILIISPRRYGKTSLCLKAFDQLKLPYTKIDLYKAFSEEDIERFILNGIGALLGKLEKTPKKLIALAGDFFSNIHVNVSIAKDGLKLDFNKRKKTPKENILNALEKLHKIAEKRQKKVILYLDEFQVVGEVCSNYAIEAVIREVAQMSEYISFVFSGSNRHLIQQQFHDKKRPFYKLCDEINLDRISETDYEKHLKKASVDKWGCELHNNTVSTILQHTKCHAYYFNKLCSILWQGNQPTPKLVDSAWINFVDENKSAIERELSLLTINQRKILTILAEEDGVIEPFGKAFLSKINMSNSSAARSIKPLLNKDYICVDNKSNAYVILDPLIKDVLAK
jgi:uncharacterized protein